MFKTPKSFYLAEYHLPLFIVFINQGDHHENLFHSHEFSEIAIVTQGTAIHQTQRGANPIGVGDVIIIHPKSTHAYGSIESFSLINIIYDAKKMPVPVLDANDLALFNSFFQRSPQIIPLNAAPVTTLNEETLQKVIELLDELDEEQKNIKLGNQFFCLALFMKILTHIARSAEQNIESHNKLYLVGDAISYINEHYMEKIPLPAIAQKTKMSTRSFSRHFKNATGMSPIQYMVYVKLDHAAEMLLNSTKNIENISTECGFNESSYFIRVFKKRFKHSPHKFRKLHRLPS